MRYLALCVLIAVLSAPDVSVADPCLVVYSDISCVYYYNTDEYYTVEIGDSLYDPEYGRGGKVLLEIGTNEIDLSIYQAPNLSGFEPSVDGNEGYFFMGTEFMLYIDGFSNQPTTYVNILVVFDGFQPPDCEPEITINGEELEGYVYSAGDLVVSTPTPYGNNYSDVITLDVSWRWCNSFRIWAFSDEDYDGEWGGGECFTAFSHDAMVPALGTTWGNLKALFK